MNGQPATAARIERLPASIDQLQQALAAQHYIADRSIAVSAFLALKLERPLLLEGEAGVGKTEVAKALASALGQADGTVRHIRYPGATYAWDYPAFGGPWTAKLPRPGGGDDLVARPWPGLAALSAAQVASFFARSLAGGAP